MDKNKELAELLGLCWHECNYTVCDYCTENPDFTSDAGKVQLLRLMMERDDFEDFFDHIKGSFYNQIHLRKENMIPLDYITDTTGKLRDACLEWLKEKGEKG